MEKKGKAVHLFCSECGELTPHSAIPSSHVNEKDERQSAKFLKREGYFDDEPLSSVPIRMTFPRGRECQICGQKHLTVEISVSSLHTLVSARKRLDEQGSVIKEIEKHRREISTLIKNLKTQ